MLCGAEELLIPQPELVKAAFPVLVGHPPIVKGAQRRTVSPCALAIYGLDSTVHATSAIRADDFGKLTKSSSLTRRSFHVCVSLVHLFAATHETRSALIGHCRADCFIGGHLRNSHLYRPGRVRRIARPREPRQEKLTWALTIYSCSRAEAPRR